MRDLPLTRLAHRLAQGGPVADIFITDVNGRPLKGVSVRVNLASESKGGPTNSDGLFRALFQTQPRSGQLAQIIAQEGEYAIQQTVDAADFRYPIYMKIPICFPGPFLTTPEMLTGGVGIALAAAGFYTKKQPLLLAGEILTGAAAFAAIFRHSCP